MSANKELAGRFFEETASIDQIILLAAQVERFGDDALEFFQENDKTIQRCLGKLPGYVVESLENDSEWMQKEVLQEWLSIIGKQGYLVQFSTPVMKNVTTISSSYSWGHYATYWVYGETIEDAIEKGFAWVAKRRKKEAGKEVAA